MSYKHVVIGLFEPCIIFGCSSFVVYFLILISYCRGKNLSLKRVKYRIVKRTTNEIPETRRNLSPTAIRMTKRFTQGTAIHYNLPYVDGSSIRHVNMRSKSDKLNRVTQTKAAAMAKEDKFQLNCMQINVFKVCLTASTGGHYFTGFAHAEYQ